MMDLIYRLLIGCYLLSINYDFLSFRNLWFLGVSIENMYETQLGLRPRQLELLRKQRTVRIKKDHLQATQLGE